MGVREAWAVLWALEPLQAQPGSKGAGGRRVWFSWFDRNHLASSTPTPALALVSADDVVKGQIVAQPLVDQNGNPLFGLESFTPVTQSLRIDIWSVNGVKVARLLGASGNNVVVTDLLPGILGDGIVGVIMTPPSPPLCGRALLASSPSYFSSSSRAIH